MVQNDFVKRTTEDDSPFLSFFLYCPAILLICECTRVCVMSVRLVGPMGTGRSLLGLPTPLPLQILGLNAEAKKMRKYDVYK